MKLYSWNVNGIRAVWKKGLLQEFVAKQRPDILCLQETKAEQGQAEVDLPEYTEYWNSASKRGYSGTAIFTKTKPLSVVNNLPEEIISGFDMTDGYGDPNNEGRVMAAEFDKFIIVNIYTPNSKGDLSRLELRAKHWDPAFLAYCKQMEKSKPLLICGDLNVAHSDDDLANPRANAGKHGFTDEERKGIQNFIDAGFVDSFRLFTKGNGHYTWWTHWANARARNVGWRIDYWLASAALKNKISSAQIHPEVMGSDHCPVSIDVAI